MPREFRVNVNEGSNSRGLVLRYTDPATGNRVTKSAGTMVREVAEHRAAALQKDLMGEDEPVPLARVENVERYWYVYFALAQGTRRVKIGVTCNLKKRVRQFSCEWPVSCVLLAAFRVHFEGEEDVDPHRRETRRYLGLCVEKYLHHTCRALRVPGKREWFRATPGLLDFITYLRRWYDPCRRDIMDRAAAVYYFHDEETTGNSYTSWLRGWKADA